MRRTDSNLSIDTSAATMSGPTMTMTSSPPNTGNYTTIEKAIPATSESSASASSAVVTCTPSSSMSNNNRSIHTKQQQQQQQQQQQNTKSDYLHYLTSYETMVRQQDSEFIATKSHMMNNVYRRVQLLGSKEKKSKNLFFAQAVKEEDASKGERAKEGNEIVEGEGGTGMLTYIQMRRCLLRLGIGWKRSYFPIKNETKMKDTEEDYFYDDDDVSVLSFNSTSSNNGRGLFSTTGSTSSSAAGASGTGIIGGGDIIVSDAQLIMLLVTLVEMEERHRAVLMTSTTSGGSSSSSCVSKTNDLEHLQQQQQIGLYLPDFILAYKLIIGGMQCIKSVNNDTFSSHSDDEEENSTAQTKLALCARLKQRTLRMLQPFGPNSFIYNEDDTHDDDDASFHTQRENHRNKQSKQTSSSSIGVISSSSEQGKLSHHDNIKGGQSIVITEQHHLQNLTQYPTTKVKQPFSNKDMMKKVMRSKDVTLAKIMEEHELEMENVSSQLESLRLEELQMRKSFQKRRMRIVFYALLAGCGVFIVGILMEKRYRLHLERELLLGQQEKERRMADARTIELLQGKKLKLEKKLFVIEGKMRYQVDRTKDMDTKVLEVTKQINDVDMKWLVDKVEIERCQSSQWELGELLTIEQIKNADGNEELVWCRSRLHSQERDLNELAHVSDISRTTAISTWGGKDSEDKIGKKIRFGFAISESSDDSGNSKKKGSHHQIRPVYLEMKYNKSMRNVMILRQTYSAVAGMTVSVFLHGFLGAWMPKSAVKILVPTLSSPSAAEVILRRAEKVVDGIFGSSVAFLLIRAVVAFVSA